MRSRELTISRSFSWISANSGTASITAVSAVLCSFAQARAFSFSTSSSQR